MLCASPRYSPVGSKLSVNPNEFSQPTRYVPPLSAAARCRRATTVAAAAAGREQQAGAEHEPGRTEGEASAARATRDPTRGDPAETRQTSSAASSRLRRAARPADNRGGARPPRSDRPRRARRPRSRRSRAGRARPREREAARAGLEGDRPHQQAHPLADHRRRAELHAGADEPRRCAASRSARGSRISCRAGVARVTDLARAAAAPSAAGDGHRRRRGRAHGARGRRDAVTAVMP